MPGLLRLCRTSFVALIPALLVAQQPRAPDRQTAEAILTIDTVPIVRIATERLIDRPHRGVVLGNHSILLLIRNGQALVHYDSTGRERWRLEITPQGSGGFGFFFDLLPHSAGRVLVWDNVLNRLTELDAGGRTRASRQVDPLPRIDLPYGGRVAQSLRLHGVLDGGDLLATTASDPTDGNGLRQDSSKVVRVDRDGGTTVIGEVLHAQHFSRADPYLVSGRLPFGRAGSIAVAGTAWYYTDGQRFVIERRGADGTLLGSFGTARTRLPVDETWITRSRLDALAESDSTLKASLIRALAATPYPDSAAAYDQLEVDARGILWARVSGPAWEPSRWDLFGLAGQPLGEIVLPARLRVLHIASAALLGYHLTPGKTHELRVYPIRRIW